MLQTGLHPLASPRQVHGETLTSSVTRFGDGL